jgi:hypothetical protein
LIHGDEFTYHSLSILYSTVQCSTAHSKQYTAD